MCSYKVDLSNVKIPKGYSNRTIQLYFWVGLVSAIALRAIIIADYYNDYVARILFYLGVIGYMAFFAHRYRIAKRRAGVLNELELLNKIEKYETLTKEDIDGLKYIIWSLSVSKERLNYLIIIVFSMIAIMVSIILDLKYLI
ncbi:hypothetical protein [Methanococcoides sp. FTZ1]|uniref:hypothetical protein n=1 Tax=Methanococcoides sp. FTZ1 TaxID=3439061 RepID=UPI003F87EE75